MSIELTQERARATSLARARERLAEVLDISDRLDEPLLSAHVSMALETVTSMLTASEQGD